MERLRRRQLEGLISTARVILLGPGMDLMDQFIVFDTFHPAEAEIIAGLFAFAPSGLITHGDHRQVPHGPGTVPRMAWARADSVIGPLPAGCRRARSKSWKPERSSSFMALRA